MIDDQFAPLTEKIKTAIASFTSGSIRFVINTHWHYDHTGGNENMGEAGAVIIAHENVRKRLSTDQVLTIFNRTIPALSKEGLPVITFTRDVTFHLNGQRIDVFHIKRAHTDGDAVAYFTDANVIHTGDILFEGMYPFIDVEHGGSISGMIDATNRILAMIDDKTRVIPDMACLRINVGSSPTVICSPISGIVSYHKSRREKPWKRSSSHVQPKLMTVNGEAGF
jgi:glyoxylase-like metal-dependent hydrolase (beta-lactamase superfamily II)